MVMRNRGFSYIELMITLAILGVLATVAVPLTELQVQRHKENELRRALLDIRTAIDQWKLAVDRGHIESRADESGYPETLEQLVEGVPDQRSPNHRNLYFLRRLPRDPLFPNASVPAADTWLKRSYASPSDDPKEGDDIYDVISRSTGVGLNGIPYQQW